MDTELFKITITFSSKWDVGFMKAISCGYMESKGVWGYHQRFEDQARRSPNFDIRSPHKKKKLRSAVANEILAEIGKVNLSLSGPSEFIEFTPVFYGLEITRNKTTFSIQWNGSSSEYYEVFNKLWHKIDDAIYFADEPKSSSYAELMNFPGFRFLRESSDD